MQQRTVTGRQHPARGWGPDKSGAIPVILGISGSRGCMRGEGVLGAAQGRSMCHVGRESFSHPWVVFPGGAVCSGVG